VLSGTLSRQTSAESVLKDAAVDDRGVEAIDEADRPEGLSLQRWLTLRASLTRVITIARG